MVNYNDIVDIKGNFKMYSTVDHRNYLKYGVMLIKGNFEQRGSNGANQYNFAANETHRVILDGDDIQYVYFESKGFSKFGILEINKPLECYQFDTVQQTRTFSLFSMSSAQSYSDTASDYWSKLIESQKERSRFGEEGVNPANGNYSNTFIDMNINVPN